MNKEREDIIKQINNTSIEDLQIDKPNKSKKEKFKEVLKDFLLGPIAFFGAFLGVTKENIGSLSNTSSHINGMCEHNHTSAHSKESTFSDNIYTGPVHPGAINQVDIANAKAFYKIADGKGDHDCGHEH